MDPLTLSAIIGGGIAAATGAGNAISAAKANKRGVKFGREQMKWQSEESQKQRDWQRETYEKYQSPSAMRRQYEEAGFNPYMATGNQIGSVGTGASASGAGGTPTQHVPDFSSTGSTIASIAQAIALSKEAETIGPRVASDIDLNKARAQHLAGDTNWINGSLRGVFDKDPEVMSLARFTAIQNYKAEADRIQLANDIVRQQKVLQNLDIEAKTISNKYLDQQHQLALAQTAASIYRDLSVGNLNNQKIKESVAQVAKLYQEVASLKLDNKAKSALLLDYIKAARLSYGAAGRESEWWIYHGNEYRNELKAQLEAMGIKLDKQAEHWLFTTLFNGAGTAVAGAVPRLFVPAAGKSN